MPDHLTKMSDLKNLPSHGYPELVRKANPRTSEPVAEETQEAAPLVDLLQDIDGIKHEIQERMRRIEAVRQAKSLLQDDESKTEALNKKLAAIGQAMNESEIAPPAGGRHPENSSLLRLQAREVLEQAGISNREIAFQQGSVEPPRLTFKEMSAGLSSAAALPEPTEIVLPILAPEPVAEMQTLHVDIANPPVVFISASEELSRAEEMWRQAEVSLAEARRIYEESTALLSEATSKSDKSSTDLLSTQQELTTAYQFAAVAAQRQHMASETFRKSHLWTVLSATLAWVALAWTAWFTVRSVVHLWVPAAASIFMLLLGVLISRSGKRKD